MKSRTKLLVILVTFAGGVLAAGPKYEAFDVTSHDDPKVVFHFSAADATRESPVVITIPGRKLTNDDRRKHLVRLKKHWLALHVPKSYTLVFRGIIECGLKITGESPYCDCYGFEDPVTKKRVDFYIYGGNWP